MFLVIKISHVYHRNLSRSEKENWEEAQGCSIVDALTLRAQALKSDPIPALW